MNSYIAVVRTIWERQGIRNGRTATEMDISAFEGNYDLKLPPIVRDYFLELNGTIGGKLGMDDERLIGFWRLDQVRPMKEEFPEYSTAEEANLFIFADYSIWVAAYAIRLTSGGDGESAVFLIFSDEPYQIAATFEEFLRRYAIGADVDEKARLYADCRTLICAGHHLEHSDLQSHQ